MAVLLTKQAKSDLCAQTHLALPPSQLLDSAPHPARGAAQGRPKCHPTFSAVAADSPAPSRLQRRRQVLCRRHDSPWCGQLHREAANTCQQCQRTIWARQNASMVQHAPAALKKTRAFFHALIRPVVRAYQSGGTMTPSASSAKKPVCPVPSPRTLRGRCSLVTAALNTAVPPSACSRPS